VKTIDAGAVSSLAELLDLARSEIFLLTASEGREFLLTEVGEPDEAGFLAEVEAIGQNRELRAFLKERSRETKRIPLSEVRKRLGLD
jgi:hypothetical protein